MICISLATDVPGWNDIIMMENDIINIVKDLYNARDDMSGTFY